MEPELMEVVSTGHVLTVNLYDSALLSFHPAA